jgi:hypothetical protein
LIKGFIDFLLNDKMEKIKIAVTFAIIIGLIGGGLYWISKNAEKSKAESIMYMNQGYKYGKGIIIQKHSYKGRSLEVKHQINGLEYECTRNWDNNPRNIGVGDSILFKYATHNPKVIITELENDY